MRFVQWGKKILAFISKRPILSGIGALAIILLLYVVTGGFGGGENANGASRAVSKGSFVQQVSVSGKVVPADDVLMAFENTGRVSKIYVQVGDEVGEGAPLVSLSLGTLAADLASAEAEVARRRAEAANRGVNLEEVEDQQSTLVESALRTLLSDDLSAVPSSARYDMEVPIITGAYNSTEEGTYKISVERKYAGSNDFTLRVFDLERAGPIDITEGEAAPIGERGLFISFPDDVSEYESTTWYVTVPNVTSASYLQNYNAYQEAKKARDKAIADAEAELKNYSEGVTIAVAELRQAEADLLRIQTEIAKMTLRAPFDGIVTAIDTTLGAAVSINDTAVSLISNSGLEIESFVPEINISFLEVGDSALVTLDAYGEQVPFAARVVEIDPAETIRDGVSTYRVILLFDSEDQRIKSGMTANILITTDRREGVITVPQGVVMLKDGKRYVPVKVGNKKESREVVVGAVSSLGTLAPAAAKRSAIARPMPRPAPVTRTALPSNMFMCTSWQSPDARPRRSLN